jgi:hypothetical protein
MERPGVFLYRDYVALLDEDVMAGLMLSQIVYWHLPSKITGDSKLRICKDGMWWLSKSHREWTLECGLSRKQSSRCLALLEARGLITTKVFAFNTAPTIHLRLSLLSGKSLLKDVPTAAELAAGTLPEKNTGGVSFASASAKPLPLKAQSNGPKGALHCSQESIPLLPEAQSITETTTETTSENPVPNGDGNVAMGASIEQPNPNGQEGKTNTEEKSMEAKKILEKMQDRPATTDEAHWKRKMSLVFPDGVLVLSSKDKAMLKSFCRLVRDVDRDPRAVMDFAVEKWGDFCSRAQLEAGLAYAPSKPCIGFLRAQWAVAVSLFLESSPPPAVPQCAPGPGKRRGGQET